MELLTNYIYNEFFLDKEEDFKNDSVNELYKYIKCELMVNEKQTDDYVLQTLRHIDFQQIVQRIYEAFYEHHCVNCDEPHDEWGDFCSVRCEDEHKYTYLER